MKLSDEERRDEIMNRLGLESQTRSISVPFHLPSAIICHHLSPKRSEYQCLAKRSLEHQDIQNFAGSAPLVAQYGGLSKDRTFEANSVFKAFGMWIPRPFLQIYPLLQEDAEVKAIGGKMAACLAASSLVQSAFCVG
jgi:hypothetical protein